MIKNLINNKIYVGSTKMSFKRRYLEHVRKLKAGVHHNTYLSNSVKKYGIKNFQFSIIEILSPSNINLIRERETFFINILDSITNGYNLSNVTTQPPFNDDTINKISNTLKEKYKKDEIFRNRLTQNSNSFKGKPSWNKGLQCNNISETRKTMFDDIEVYDLNMTFFRKFDNAIEIEKFSKSKDNDLPIPDYIEFNNVNAGKVTKKFLRNKVVASPNIHRAIRNNKPYKGLYFKKTKRI